MALPPTHQQRRILVVDPECLLAAGLIQLLSDEAGADIQTVSSAGPGNLAAAVRAHQPHAVVLPLSLGRRFPHDLLACLSDAFVTHLVCINPNCGAVRVFELTEVTVTSIEDLLPLLHAPPPLTQERRIDSSGKSTNA